jgi:hypothetical protein
MTPLFAILIGLAWYLAVWLRHDATRTPMGVWRNPPHTIRRFLRLGAGPVYLAGIALESWGLAMVIIGLAAQIGVIDHSVSPDVMLAAMLWLGPVAALWLGLALAGLVRR